MAPLRDTGRFGSFKVWSRIASARVTITPRTLTHPDTHTESHTYPTRYTRTTLTGILSHVHTPHHTHPAPSPTLSLILASHTPILSSQFGAKWSFLDPLGRSGPRGKTCVGHWGTRTLWAEGVQMGTAGGDVPGLGQTLGRSGCGIRLKTMPPSLRLEVGWGLPSLGSLGLHPDTTPIPGSHHHPSASLLSSSPSWSFLPSPKPSHQPSTDLTLSPPCQNLPWFPIDLRTKPSS